MIKITNPADPPHDFVRIAPGSRRQPSVLHVNRESREEALKFYHLTNFEKQPRIHKRRVSKLHQTLLASTVPKTYAAVAAMGNELAKQASSVYKRENSIYYNPQLDTIYLGQGSCISTLVHLLREGMEIPKMAIGYREEWANCYHSFHECGLLQILHGVHRPEDHLPIGFTNLWPGCEGLKEVSLVIMLSGYRPMGENYAEVRLLP
jgi:hypothetical protein